MDSFEYRAAGSLQEALEMLGERPGVTKILAGGTDLLVQMKEGTVQPQQIVDLGGIESLQGIRQQEGAVWIGPLTSHREVARSSLICTHGLTLAQGASGIGSPQIRNRGTIGGNIANASPAADTLPPLVVLGGEVQISSAAGSRWEQAESLLRGPGQTMLKPEELISAVRFPLAGEGFRSRYLKFGSRNALSIAVTSVAVAAVMGEENRLSAVRIAMGSVGPTIMRASGAEELLSNGTLSKALITQAALSAGQQCCPIDDVRGSAWYRRQLVEALLRRALSDWLEEN